MHKIKLSLGLLFVIVFFSPFLGGDLLYSDDSQSKNIISLNNITVTKIQKEIRIKAKLAITEGILEYLLVGHQGKTYESVFKVIDNKPSELNFALLLIGCKALKFDSLLELTNDPDGLEKLLKNHKESILEIDIIKDGKKVDMQSLMRNREGSGNGLVWVYTEGVFIEKHGYAADLEFSYIGIWPDMVAVINLFSTLKNPYGGDFGFEINKGNNELTVDQDFEILIRRYPS